VVNVTAHVRDRETLNAKLASKERKGREANREHTDFDRKRVMHLMHCEPSELDAPWVKPICVGQRDPVVGMRVGEHQRALQHGVTQAWPREDQQQRQAQRKRSGEEAKARAPCNAVPSTAHQKLSPIVR